MHFFICWTNSSRGLAGPWGYNGQKDALGVPTSLFSLVGHRGRESDTQGRAAYLPTVLWGRLAHDPCSLNWTCLCVGVSRIQLATDKLETAASAACGARPDVCMVSIDDKVSVISRPPVLLGELADS